MTLERIILAFGVMSLLFIAACSQHGTPALLHGTLTASAKTQASSPVKSWQLDGTALGVEVAGVDEEGIALDTLKVSLFGSDHNQLHTPVRTSSSHKDAPLIKLERELKTDMNDVYVFISTTVDGNGNVISSQVEGDVDETLDNMRDDLEVGLLGSISLGSVEAAQAKWTLATLDHNHACVLGQGSCQAATNELVEKTHDLLHALEGK